MERSQGFEEPRKLDRRDVVVGSTATTRRPSHPRQSNGTEDRFHTWLRRRVKVKVGFCCHSTFLVPPLSELPSAASILLASSPSDQTIVAATLQHSAYDSYTIVLSRVSITRHIAGRHWHWHSRSLVTTHACCTTSTHTGPQTHIHTTNSLTLSSNHACMLYNINTHRPTNTHTPNLPKCGLYVPC
jgi:hypothetical protein